MSRQRRAAGALEQQRSTTPSPTEKTKDVSKATFHHAMRMRIRKPQPQHPGRRRKKRKKTKKTGDQEEEEEAAHLGREAAVPRKKRRVLVLVGEKGKKGGAVV